MLISPAVFAAIAVLAVGILIFWSNPTRGVNRIVFSCSVHIALWLYALNLAISSEASTGLFWLRWTVAIAALIPLHLWLVKEFVAENAQKLRDIHVKKAVIWASLTIALAAICFTDYFIPSTSTPARRLYGTGYYIYIISSLGLYVALAVDSLRRIKTLTGGRRLALQVWLGGGCGAAGSILLLMAINAATHRYIKLQPFVVLVYYAATAFAITTHRIFDARQILLLAIEKLVLIVTVAFAAYGLDLGFSGTIPQPLGLVVTTALSLWLAVSLNGWLNRVFRFYPEATAARQAAFAVARKETRVEDLEKAFSDILKGWGQTEHALIVSVGKGVLRGDLIEIAEDSPVLEALRQLRWATPERLMRERSSPERHALAAFLEQNQLGALAIAEGPTLTALVGVGTMASRRPFTYPQITQLIELSSIIESALERAHFSVKAQHAEQLATVGLLGASLAHEIRNPLVTIKTFVQLLPQHYHDPVFRDKFFNLIGGEVTRIDRLTEQLLDLASPRAYSAELIELHPVLRTSLELVAAKASDKQIGFLTEFEASPDRVVTDASAAKQVLINLCFNAIQAVEKQDGDRWVKVATRNLPSAIEVLVEDSGPGISDEIRPRLFQPFQSTKSSGFGLGLAICRDILAGLDATITVDPTVAGRGASFRVVFPCPA